PTTKVTAVSRAAARSRRWRREGITGPTSPSRDGLHKQIPGVTDVSPPTRDFGFRAARSRPVRWAVMAEPTSPITDPSGSDTPPHRYTATLAGQIETSWQDRWERDGTFLTPNPAGDLSAGFDKV